MPRPLRCLVLLFLLVSFSDAAEPAVRSVPPRRETVLVSAATQPAEFRYTAFPTLLMVGSDEAWLAYKAGRGHSTDAGAAMEVVRHTLSSGTTTLIQRLPAPAPKLYQMGELTRMPDGTVALYVDVQAVGWDGRHYRAGAEVFRWNTTRLAFDAPTLLETVNGVRYGYPLDFISEGKSTWQLIMAFGYMEGGRWSVDALRSENSGGSWKFVRNLTAEFGGIRANESAFVRHGDNFIVTTRGYDNQERLHLTSGEFRVRRQVELTGKYPFINSHIGRPRLFVRDGQGYLIGRNRTQSAAAAPMQLCLFRFDPETLAIASCVVLDNADNKNVTDGYYAVPAFSGVGAGTRLHVFTYKAVGGEPPGIVRFDYNWDDVK